MLPGSRKHCREKSCRRVEVSPFPAAVVAPVTAFARVQAQERREDFAEPSACPKRAATVRPLSFSVVLGCLPSHQNLLDTQSWDCRLS